MLPRRPAWRLALATHALAGVAILISLRLFLTPPAEIASAPPQPMRYAIYAFSALSGGSAAGTLLGVLVTGGSWLPAVYLWLLPLILVALPQIDPAVAGFVYAGFAGRLGFGLAVAAAMLWIVGCIAGFVLAYALERPR